MLDRSDDSAPSESDGCHPLVTPFRVHALGRRWIRRRRVDERGGSLRKRSTSEREDWEGNDLADDWQDQKQEDLEPDELKQ